MIHNLSAASLGGRLRGAAYAVAPFLVFVYTAGYMLGQWIHSTNDRLAAAHARWIGDAWRFDQPSQTHQWHRLSRRLSPLLGPPFTRRR